MRPALLLLVAACAVAACNSDAKNPPPATRPSPVEQTSVQARVVLPDGTACWVELATDDDTRQEGLMYRESLLPNHGMLFIFPNSGEYPFWMKNTLIALDMIWIDESGTIVHVAENVPPCKADPCPSYPPHAIAKYVLELAAGEAARHQVESGRKVRFLDTAQFAVR